VRPRGKDIGSGGRLATPCYQMAQIGEPDRVAPQDQALAAARLTAI
jgi:hypothetical protein